MGKDIYLLIACIVCCHVTFFGQITVGLQFIDNPYPGYNLFYPHKQSSTYLLNNCGEIVHQWTDEDNFRPGNIALITDEGTLIRAKRPTEVPPTFGAGGAGGIIEWRTWDNELIYDINFIDTLTRAHHDIHLLPSGNVLAIIWEKIDLGTLIAAGGDTTLHTSGAIWPDFIVEIDPILDSVVWEWHAWDHLIQEFDSTKANFGVVMDHPNRIDLNYNLGLQAGKADWMHTNSIDYREDLDQILLSVPHFNEIWIIDHGTTTDEAKGPKGDLLFRWGNPASYQAGNIEDQELFFQHDARWVQEADGSYSGLISIFNNRIPGDISLAYIIAPKWSLDESHYTMQGDRFLPNDVYKKVGHPDMNVFSSGLSSFQVLPNENMLFLIGREGLAFEVDNELQLQWQYKVPLKSGEPVSQGETLETNDNLTFQLNRYPEDFKGFTGRDLSPLGLIELNGNSQLCDMTVSSFDLNHDVLKVYPNPTNGILYVNKIDNTDIHLYNEVGEMMVKTSGSVIDCSNLPSGIYYVRHSGYTQILVIQ